MSDVMIDGVAPDRIERPTGADQVAELLREASLSGAWVLPIGGGTSMRGANPIDGVPVALDTTGLSGITGYTPADMTVSVGAGTRWSHLLAALAEHGQALPIDVPFPDRATVGGVVATGYAGPRRLRDGTLKDLLLGASYVRGDGLAAKAGGMVVKNVSGFEIPRLLHGSWGSLAIIASVNLKVLPASEHELTLTAGESDTVEAAESVLALTRSRSSIASATIDGTLDAVSAAIRLTGRAAPTRELATEIRGGSGFAWDEPVDDAATSAAWWQEREDRLAGVDEQTVSIDIGCPPSALTQMLATLRNAFPNPASVALHASPGTGAIGLAFPADTLSLGAWAGLWSEHDLGQHGRFVVTAAPRQWRAARDVWFIEPGPRKIMQALKASFDPNDILNRGRLWTTSAAAPV